MFKAFVAASSSLFLLRNRSYFTMASFMDKAKAGIAQAKVRAEELVEQQRERRAAQQGTHDADTHSSTSAATSAPGQSSNAGSSKFSLDSIRSDMRLLGAQCQSFLLA